MHHMDTREIIRPISYKVALWAEHPFQLYSALKLIENDIDNISLKSPVIITKRDNRWLLKNDNKLSAYNCLYIDDFHKKWHSKVRLILESFLVPINFSTVYLHKSQSFQRARVLRFIQKHIPRLFRVRDINGLVRRVYVLLNYLFCRGTIRFDRIYCFTKVYYVGALHRLSDTHISIMESWDHPMKFPYFFVPRLSYTWNHDLASDERIFQGIRNHHRISPLKFSYIDEFKHLSIEDIESRLSNTEYSEEIQRLKGKKFVLYPTTTSSNGLEHQGELRLIESMLADFAKLEIPLYIKPKPNGPVGDYDYLIEKFSNVMIGKYSASPDSSDMLKTEYHMFRLYLIKKALITINCGSTFGLEVSYAHAPLIQLSLSEIMFGSFASYVRTYHLNKYILSIDGVLEYTGNQFGTNILNDLIRDNDISEKLFRWISIE